MTSPRAYPVEKLEGRLGRDRIRRDVVLAPYTTFRIGGPADLFFQAQTAEELVLAVTSARRLEIPYFLLGLGANILVADRGFRGLVILNRARSWHIDAEEAQVTAESGVIMDPDLIEATVTCGLSGLEHFVGIPSTVGGALWQNLHFLSPAPARDHTVFLGPLLLAADLLGEGGDERSEGREYFRFGYDDSILHHRRDVVLRATFQLAPGDPQTMRRIMAENRAWRAQRHPPLDREPSAGSIFKKVEGIGAGRLIDECGLKGTRVGAAAISPRHANIIVNLGGATAEDVRGLIRLAQEAVKRATGHSLEVEISWVGEHEPG